MHKLLPNPNQGSEILAEAGSASVGSALARTVLFPRLRSGSVEALCQILREKYETSVVPGAFFEAPEHFRMYLAAETSMLSEALERLGAALGEI